MTGETRTLPDFSEIALEGNGELTLIQGESCSVVIETDPETLEHLKVEVVNGRLVLGLKSWVDALRFIWKRVAYTVTYRQLKRLSISGSGKAQAAQLEAERFGFRVSGSGSLVVGHLKTGHLDVDISGSANLSLSGSAAHQDVQISGSAKMEAEELDSQSARVHISGSGNLLLKVSETLDVNISGSGSVRYLGSPRVNQSILGSGSIKPAR